MNRKQFSTKMKFALGDVGVHFWQRLSSYTPGWRMRILDKATLFLKGCFAGYTHTHRQLNEYTRLCTFNSSVNFLIIGTFPGYHDH